MTPSTHIFRCHADDAGDFVDVEATTHGIARELAVQQRGWKIEDVVTRYIRSVCNRPHDERDTELRKALAGVK